MRKTFSRLAFAAATILLLGSCSKINGRIDSLEERLNGLESEKIASIESQITSINSSIADLGTIRNDIKTLQIAVDAKGEGIIALKAADEALGKRIDELQSYVDSELENYASTDWVKATFATLEQHEWTCDTIAKIDARIAALDKNLSDAIDNSVETMKGWVNKELSAYYTIAQMDAKVEEIQALIDTTSNTNKETLEQLSEELTSTKSAIELAKAAIRLEYQDAIKTAIETSEGKLTSDLKKKIASVNSRIDELTPRVSDLETKVANLENEVKGLKDMIQSISIIPDYNDGTIKEVESSTLTINCFVSPASALADVTEEDIKVIIYEAATKATTFTQLDASSAEITKDNDTPTGYVTIKATVPDNVPAGDNILTAAVRINTDYSHYTSDFVPVARVQK